MTSKVAIFVIELISDARDAIAFDAGSMSDADIIQDS